MELEDRVEALEHEVKILKTEIQQTLLDIRQTLPDKPAAPARWQKKAWVLALLNMLLAVSLFANIYLYLPDGSPFNLNPMLAAWLRAFWIAMAFMWLILQLYPLVLLLEQEDRQWQGIVWRNARAYLRARPGAIALSTLIVLLIAIVQSIFPVVWFVVVLLLLLGAAGLGVQWVLQLLRSSAR
jgi:hypothetical protein